MLGYPMQKKKAAAGVKNCEIQNRIVQADHEAKPISVGDRKNCKGDRLSVIVLKYNPRDLKRCCGFSLL